LGRTEAIQLGLPIAERDPETERLMWSVWRDIEDELIMRKPFNPLAELMSSTKGEAGLTMMVPQAKCPPGGPPVQVMLNVPLADVFRGGLEIEPARFTVVNALMESRRIASRFTTVGWIVGARAVDLNVAINVLTKSAHWSPVPIGEAQGK